MAAPHTYHTRVRWTGNTGDGTATYDAYGRDFEVSAEGKPVLVGSADPRYRGDAARYNPEDLLVAAASSCHMLWFLHLAAEAGVVVTAYQDDASGMLQEDGAGYGRITEIMLRPSVAFTAPVAPDLYAELHDAAHDRCYIASSLTCPVRTDLVPPVVVS